MNSVSSVRLGIVIPLAIFFIVWPKPIAMGIGTTPDRFAAAKAAQEELIRGFEEIQNFFLARNFSLIEAWRSMRSSGDPDFFDRTYPEISEELDAWVERIEARHGTPSDGSIGPDYTFVLTRFVGRVLDAAQPEVVRDNALATICMVCVMDDLRCDADRLHALLAAVVEKDPSVDRKSEALRWWRITSGRIAPDLLERLLTGPEGGDTVLRAEIARTLFSQPTTDSLRAQQYLFGATAEVQAEMDGQREQIACTAMRHLARAGFMEATPRMLTALEDHSLEVRSCAVESLVRLSGMDVGFDPESDRSSNAAALGRWRTWWEEQPASRRGAVR